MTAGPRGHSQSTLDAIAEANPELARLGRDLARLERLEHDIGALIKRYERKRRTDYHILLSDAAYDLQEILDGKP